MVKEMRPSLAWLAALGFENASELSSAPLHITILSISDTP
jgi:hypothetical protein